MKRILALVWILVFGFLTFAIANPLPDTGQTACYDDMSKLISCPCFGQPFYGQDANYTINPKSYIKLGHNGVELPPDAQHFDGGGDWIMTRDNVTGLIWEVKNLANKNDQHTWENAKNVFIANLNNLKFGSFSDWRLPSREELSTLSDRSRHNPAIDLFWFPNTISWRYWSFTQVAEDAKKAWRVNADIGFVYYEPKTSFYYVRAVRGPAMGYDMVDNDDGTVTDKKTGLIWQKCTFGQTWNNTDSVCKGDPLLLTWQEALERAAEIKNWRLPNINELQSIVDDSVYDPAIYKPFRNHLPPSLVSPDPYCTYTLPYWSSTTDVRFTEHDRAWIINFVDGSNNYDGYDGDQGVKSSEFYIRLVRGGQIVSDRILNWAECVLPEFLPTSDRIIHDEDGLYVRYYPSTGIYLGGYQGRLLYYHPALSPEIYDLGSLDEFLAMAIGAGF